MPSAAGDRHRQGTTPYLVHCPHHGEVFLTYEEYMAQMMNPDAKWCCPLCGENASWDDEWYETHPPGEPLPASILDGFDWSAGCG